MDAPIHGSPLMAVTNPFSITYGGRVVGGSTSYLLHGPYVIDRSFDNIRVVFDVVVVGSSHSDLKTLSDALEIDFRKRDQSLVIDLNGSTWTYTFGTTILNTTANLSKSGDPQIDRGFSRGYTCVIEGELPADDASPATGLRDISFNVDFEASRQKIVTIQGTYTATSARLASANYLRTEGADTEATVFLLALDNTATWQLVDEDYIPDRKDHVATFTRQYVELLISQTTTALPNDGAVQAGDIKDHRVVFTDTSQHPGDTFAGTFRLRRVLCSYDCSIDIERTTDLQNVFDKQIMPHILALFKTNFNPVVLCIEEQRESYDETTKRMSVGVQFLYQKKGGDNIVEVSQSTAFRENRTIDYTPVHGKDELAAYADPGWLVLEFVVTRTAVVLGSAEPVTRLEGSPVVSSGWNLIQNTSQVTPQFIGDPNEQQIEVSVIAETMVWRFNRKPALGTVTPVGGPLTGGRSGGLGGPITPGGGGFHQ